jgi:hypothetical protein
MARSINNLTNEPTDRLANYLINLLNNNGLTCQLTDQFHAAILYSGSVLPKKSAVLWNSSLPLSQQNILKLSIQMYTTTEITFVKTYKLFSFSYITKIIIQLPVSTLRRHPRLAHRLSVMCNHFGRGRDNMNLVWKNNNYKLVVS